jgi:endoglycosylceramidase
VLAGLLAGCGGAGSPATPPGGTGPTGALAPLHVVHPSGATAGSAAAVPYLANAAGQRVILRGVAASGFEDQAYSGAVGTTPHYPIDPAAYDGRCPANDSRAPDPPLCEVQAATSPARQSTAPGSQDDFAQMRAAGFDLVRLTINWSELEPTAGTYSTTFLDRIAQVVGWARQQGIRVILDMHQDGYSRFLTSPADASVPQQAPPPGCTPADGQDGAPAWAVFTDGKPSCGADGQSQLNLAGAEAFLNFWDNRTVPGPQGEAPGTGLQDHYIGALEALARRFAGNPAVLGYEVMNEPLPGSSAPLPLANLYDFSDQQLLPFTERAIEALTGVRDGKPTCPADDPSGTAAEAALHRTVVPQVPAEVDPCAYPPGPVLVHSQMILFEPTGYRNQADFSPQLSTGAALAAHPFSQYPDLVFAPHIYTHVFTLDTLLGGVAASGPQYPPSYTFGYATAEAEAASLGAALLVTEFGDPPSSDSTILAGMVAAQRQARVGTVFWTWKENCGSASGPCANGWGVYRPPVPSGGHLAQNGPLDTARLALLTSNPVYDGSGTPPAATQQAPALAPLPEPQARTQLDTFLIALGASSAPAKDRSLATVLSVLMASLLGPPSADPNGPPAGSPAS